MSKINSVYNDVQVGNKLTFMYITEDTRGLKLMKPLVAVSINGSAFQDIEELLKMQTIFKERHET